MSRSRAHVGELDTVVSIPAPPSNPELRASSALLEPWRTLTAPHFTGLDHIPASGRVLLVGNHTIFGLLDAPLMLTELHRARGRFVYTVGDRSHFAVPVWRDFLQRFGAVPGTRATVAALLGRDEAVLVFPGGAREVYKRKHEKYRLIWEERIGFARLAVRHGCPIVPFASVGADDSWEVLVDAEDPLHPGLIKRLTGRADIGVPIVRGIGPTLLPRPQRLYFRFGAPIAAPPYVEADEDDLAHAVRDEAHAAVEHLITEALEFRRRDPDRGMAGRLRVATRRARGLRSPTEKG